MTDWFAVILGAIIVTLITLQAIQALIKEDTQRIIRKYTDSQKQ